MRTILLDDEPDALNSLKIIINEYIPEIEIVGIFSNPKEALIKIPELEPELLFLDIHMPEINAFQLLEMLPHRNFHIIFATAYDEYAIKAFKYNAIDYLLKPINVKEVVNSIKRIKENQDEFKDTYEIKYKALLDTMKNENHSSEKMIISTIEGIHYVKPSDILYIIADSNYSKIIFKNAHPLSISKKLKALQEDLPQGIFFRNHHSYLVNLNYVQKYVRNNGGTIEIVNGDKIPLARRKRNEFHEKMKSLVKKV